MIVVPHNHFDVLAVAPFADKQMGFDMTMAGGCTVQGGGRWQRSLCALLVGCITATTICSSASADRPDDSQPTTRPTSRNARSDWGNVVTDLARALVQPEDSGTIAAIADDVVIREFNKSRRQSIAQLHETLRGMTVITTRAYMETPQTLANDLAVDLKDSPVLSDDIKRHLTPTSADSIKRANVTAAKWIAASLMTSGTDPIGIVVLWRQPSQNASDPATNAEAEQGGELPMFILVRGETTSGVFRIREICYGDPLPLGQSDTKSDVAGTGDSAGD